MFGISNVFRFWNFSICIMVYLGGKDPSLCIPCIHDPSVIYAVLIVSLCFDSVPPREVMCRIFY